MESFYGGRQGASLAIKASFQYLSDSKKKLPDGTYSLTEYLDPYYGQALNALIGQPDPDPAKEGAPIETLDRAAEILAPQVMRVQFDNHEYKDVWYGEYCIIDTKNKNNKNNGKIYRRTLKQATVDDERWVGGVAEYIGQIVGPAGPSPILDGVSSVNKIEEQFDNESLTDLDVIYFRDEQGKYRETKKPDDNLYVSDFISSINLIRGNTQNKYNDTGDSTQTLSYIQHGGHNWYNIKRYNADGTEEITKFYLGFDIPYYYTEFEGGRSLDYKQSPTLERTINVSNIVAPFFEKYKINIPRGITGAYISNIKIKTTDSSEKYIKPEDIVYDINTDSYSAPSNKLIEGNGKEAWTATFYWIKSPTPENNSWTQQTIPNIYLCERKDAWITNIRRTVLEDKNFFYIPTEEEQSSKPVEINHLLLQINNYDYFPIKPTVQEIEIENDIVTNTVIGQWIDLGCIQEVLDGLFIHGMGLTARPETQDREAGIAAAIETLGEVDPIPEKGVPVEITYPDGSSEVVVFYYDFEDEGGKWKELGQLSASGQGTVQIKNGDTAIIGNVIYLQNEPIISGNNLSTPWRL